MHPVPAPKFFSIAFDHSGQQQPGLTRSIRDQAQVRQEASLVPGSAGQGARTTLKLTEQTEDSCPLPCSLLVIAASALSSHESLRMSALRAFALSQFSCFYPLCPMSASSTVRVPATGNATTHSLRGAARACFRFHTWCAESEHARPHTADCEL